MQNILDNASALKLLIVDDNGELRKLLKLTFGYGKYQIFEAENGFDALKIAFVNKPDIVLLDIMMPGEIDGLDVCRKIKSSNELMNSCVILLTAKGQKNDIELGKQAGADFYIVKPFSPVALIELIEKQRFIDPNNNVD